MRSFLLEFRSRRSRPLAPLALIWLAGCTVLPPPPGLEHPANPKAAEAPASPASSALSPDHAELPPDPAAGREAPVDHGSMQHDGVPAASPEGTEPAPHTEATPRAEAEMLRYSCPMHPEVQSDEPGRCPKCGMNLEEKGAP